MLKIPTIQGSLVAYTVMLLALPICISLTAFYFIMRIGLIADAYEEIRIIAEKEQKP